MHIVWDYATLEPPARGASLLLNLTSCNLISHFLFMFVLKMLRITASFLKVMRSSRHARHELLYGSIVWLFVLYWACGLLGMLFCGCNPLPWSLLGEPIRAGASVRQLTSPIEHAAIGTLFILFGTWTLTQSLIWMNAFPMVFLSYFIWTNGNGEYLLYYGDISIGLAFPMVVIALLRLWILQEVYHLMYLIYYMAVHKKYETLSVMDIQRLIDVSSAFHDRTPGANWIRMSATLNEALESFFDHRKGSAKCRSRMKQLMQVVDA